MPKSEVKYGHIRNQILDKFGNYDYNNSWYLILEWKAVDYETEIFMPYCRQSIRYRT